MEHLQSHCKNFANEKFRYQSPNCAIHNLSASQAWSLRVFSAAGTGTGTSLRVVQKCVRLSTTSPPHRPTKKVISCSSGTMTTATPRTTSSANTRKVNHQICAVVSGCFTGWSNSVIWGGSKILKLRICLLVFQKWFPKSDYCIHCLLLIIIMVECTMFGVSSSLSLFSFLFFSTPAIFVCMIKLWRFVFTPSVNTLFHLFYFSTGAEFFFYRNLETNAAHPVFFVVVGRKRKATLFCFLTAGANTNSTLKWKKGLKSCLFPL